MAEVMLIICCPHCGDTFEVTPSVVGITKDWWNYFAVNGMSGEVTREMLDSWKTLEDWWENPKECLHCHQSYSPLERKMIMDDFVFNAFRTVKMG